MMIPIDPNATNSTNKLAFSTRCMPGSVAEQQEKERLEEFQRNKAQRLVDERNAKPEADARRHEAYLADCQTIKDRMHRGRMDRYKVVS